MLRKSWGRALADRLQQMEVALPSAWKIVIPKTINGQVTVQVPYRFLYRHIRLEGNYAVTYSMCQGCPFVF